jgi:Tfp pilus assembly protein PilF
MASAGTYGAVLSVGLLVGLAGCSTPPFRLSGLSNSSGTHGWMDPFRSRAATPEADLADPNPSSGTAQPHRGLLTGIVPASWLVREPRAGEPKDPGEARCRVALAMGQIYEKREMLLEAEEHYEEALRAEPNSLEAILALGRVYQRTGRHDSALELYRQAIVKHRDQPALWNDLGLCYAALQQYGPAEEALRHAVRLDPMRALYRNNLASVLAAQGRYKEAWEEFRKAVGPALAHYNLAVVAAEIGDPATAHRHLQEALRLQPELEDARRLLSELDQPTARTSVGKEQMASDKMPGASGGNPTESQGRQGVARRIPNQ